MQKVKHIVKKARGHMSQTEFARLLGKSQGLISKYERGIVSPPADTLDKCIDILQLNNASEEVTVESLTKRIRKELKEPELAYVRTMISNLLDGIQGDKKAF